MRADLAKPARSMTCNICDIQRARPVIDLSSLLVCAALRYIGRAYVMAFLRCARMDPFPRYPRVTRRLSTWARWRCEQRWARRRCVLVRMLGDAHELRTRYVSGGGRETYSGKKPRGGRGGWMMLMLVATFGYIAGVGSENASYSVAVACCVAVRDSVAKSPGPL